MILRKRIETYQPKDRPLSSARPGEILNFVLKQIELFTAKNGMKYGTYSEKSKGLVPGSDQ
ncbi:MAG: hypothetical protein RLZZ165_1420 [Bacteroidota bacterium]|jgi:hypothetical protein